MVEMQLRRFPRLDYQSNESINTLCTNLFFAGGDYKKLMLTSCRPGEGKSFVGMNLMRSLANMGMRVVLVDADIRASKLQNTYGIVPETDLSMKYQGITRYLTGKCSVDDILIQTDIPNAYMVLAGKTVNNSMPLLNTMRMRQLLDNLADRFDIVLIDTPPVGTVIDAARILDSCDGVIFVIQSEAIRPRELQIALMQIQKTGKPLLGTVLNQFDDKKYGDKYYYYNSYYNDSGSTAKGLRKSRKFRKGI